MEAGQIGLMIGDHATNPVDLELGGKREPVPTRDPLMEAETVPGKDLKDHWNVTTGPVWKVNTKSIQKHTTIPIRDAPEKMCYGVSSSVSTSTAVILILYDMMNIRLGLLFMSLMKDSWPLCGSWKIDDPDRPRRSLI